MQHISYILQDEYDQLIQQKSNLEEQYKTQAKRKRESCEQGAETRHDNADYEDAEYQQRILSKRIGDIQSILHNTKVLLHTVLQPETVSIGSTVTLLIDNKKVTYMIGGHPTLPGRISYQSPLGKVLINSKPGETINFTHGNQNKKITILSLI